MTNSASEPGDDDVLASIRRLVAATPDRSAAANGATPGSFSKGSAADRLLLTPALRVAEPEACEGASVPHAPRGLTLEDRIAELEAAVGSQASEFEPDGSEIAHVEPPEELVRAIENLEIDGDDAEQAAGGSGDEAPEQAPEQGPSLEPERRRLFLAASTPEPGAGVPHARPEASGEALADLPAGLFFTRHERAASVTPLETPAVPEAAVEPVDGTDSEADERAGGPPDEIREVPEEIAEEEIAAPVEPVVQLEEVAEAVPGFRHAAVFTAIHEPPRDAEAMPKAPESDAAAVEDFDTPAVHAVAEMLLDEEKLREIVAELLRDELQGPLGEKITRNIRKLVRREIERALTVREFD